MDLWRQYNRDLGRINMAKHLPQVMEDIAVDAVSREGACPRCDGEGQVGRLVMYGSVLYVRGVAR